MLAGTASVVTGVGAGTVRARLAVDGSEAGPQFLDPLQEFFGLSILGEPIDDGRKGSAKLLLLGI